MYSTYQQVSAFEGFILLKQTDHEFILSCLHRVATEAIKKEAFPHCLGLLARLFLSPE